MILLLFAAFSLAVADCPALEAVDLGAQTWVRAVQDVAFVDDDALLIKTPDGTFALYDPSITNGVVTVTCKVLTPTPEPSEVLTLRAEMDTWDFVSRLVMDRDFGLTDSWAVFFAYNTAREAQTPGTGLVLVHNEPREYDCAKITDPCA